MVHQLHKGRQSEGQQVSKTKGQDTQRHTQTIGRFSLADGLEQCIICKALKGRAVGRNRENGAYENQFNAATRLAEERQKTGGGGEKNKWGQRLEMQCRQTGLRETAGAIRKSAGAGQHRAAFNQDQKAML